MQEGLAEQAKRPRAGSAIDSDESARGLALRFERRHVSSWASLDLTD